MEHIDYALLFLYAFYYQPLYTCKTTMSRMGEINYDYFSSSNNRTIILFQVVITQQLFFFK